MLFIAILIAFVFLAIVGACLFIEKRAIEQDPKYMNIRDNIMLITKK